MKFLPKRSPFGHKGDYGLTLLVGGSRGMSGAIALAGKAALRAGAGLVRLAVPESILATVASFSPEIMTCPLPESRGGRIALDASSAILRQCETAKAVALGPGLGRSLGLTALVVRLFRQIEKPLLVDADALNALAERNFGADSSTFSRSGALPPRVLTPHPGEFARLLGGEVPGETTEEEFASRIELVQAFAAKTGTILLLKGHRTIISDGRAVEINRTGNPGMGTGGSGDVLTGLIAGLISQGLTPFEAAVLGAHLHGSAGDIAAARLGEASVTAGSILEALPEAMQYSNEGDCVRF